MSRWFSAAVAAVLVLVLGLAGSAIAAPEETVRLIMDGKVLATVGKLVNDTTFVPVKTLGVELGARVSAYDPGRTTVTYHDARVTFTTGSGVVVVNGHEMRCSTPFLENDRLLVPARFFLESLGFQVTWSSDPQNTVDIHPVAGNKIVVGTVSERQETSTLLIDIQHPKVSGSPSTVVQDAMNAFFAVRTADSKAKGVHNEKDMIAAGFTQWPTEVSLNYTVEYNQKGFLGILFEDYLYVGGAHGMTYRSGYFVDITTGRTYNSLKDLFKEGTDYVPLLSAEVRKQFDARGWTLLQPFIQIRPDQGFYIKDNDLVVYTDVYEYTPYVMGYPEFHIPLASLAGVLIPELAAVAQ